MRKFSFKALAAAAAVCSMAMIQSCGESRQGWTIAGNIDGAADSTLFIEEQSGAAWIIVDSLHTDRDGNFSFTAVSPAAKGQQIYRIRMGSRAVYFPVEGKESLSLQASGEKFGTRHTLSGTAAAAGFNTVDSLIADAVDRVGASAAVNDSALFGHLSDIILNDTTCIVGYYAVMHPVDDKFVFNVNDRKKLGLIGAVATRYKTSRPGHPYGQQLEQLYLSAKRPKQGTGRSMEAALISRPDIDFVRKDEKGNDVDLNAVLDRGGVTVVNLTRYDDDASASNTLALGEAYKKYSDRGVEIYQIGFDSNRAYWQQNALSMPWITVYSSPDESIEFLMAYNANPVDGGPISLIFNREGELVKRVTDPTELDKAIAEAL